MVTIVDPSPARILRQGAATLVASANPLPGVSWGAWAGGPVAVQTIAGTTPVARPVFWLTMAPPSNLPTSGSTNYSLVSGAATNNGATATLTSVTATVFFVPATVTGNIIVTGANTWNANFTGGLNGSTFNAPATGLVDGFTLTGSVVGGLSGPNANTIGGVFDLEQAGVPAVHAEGVFVAQ